MNEYCQARSFMDFTHERALPPSRLINLLTVVSISNWEESEARWNSVYKLRGCSQNSKCSILHVSFSFVSLLCQGCPRNITTHSTVCNLYNFQWGTFNCVLRVWVIKILNLGSTLRELSAFWCCPFISSLLRTNLVGGR